MHSEYSREFRATLVNRERIVAVHQHMPAPLAHANHEKLDLEIGRRLPLAKHLEDSFLGVLILYRRTLRPFEPNTKKADVRIVDLIAVFMPLSQTAASGPARRQSPLCPPRPVRPLPVREQPEMLRKWRWHSDRHRLRNLCCHSTGSA